MDTGKKSGSQPVEPPTTTASADEYAYSFMLRVDPEQAVADDRDRLTATATLKSWPHGAPLKNLSVHFSITKGDAHFLNNTKSVTAKAARVNDDWVASVDIKSLIAEIGWIRAVVEVTPAVTMDSGDSWYEFQAV